MSYTKNTWVDQDVERPKTYEVTKNQDGSITLTDSFGLVKELGTPVNAVNMNHIEDGIDGCAIRKHNLTETFNLGEWVLGGTGDVEGIYKSLIPNNVGNAISDTTAWQKVEMGGGYEVGDVIWRLTPTQDSGKHLFDGALINGSGSYAAFVTYIAGLVTDYPDLFVTEADWQSSVSTYGVCGKFVYNATDNTVRLPKITGILEGTTDITALGDLVEAGLPNITGIIDYPTAGTPSGAFASEGTRTYQVKGGTGGSFNYASFDATRSSSIYGNSSTVQPQTIKCYYYIVIATSTKTDIQVDIDQVATDLNGKADTDLTNTTDSAKVLMSGMGMPSDKYIDLTLGASDTTYTAPANGYVYFNKACTAAGQYITLSANISYRAWSTASGQSLLVSVPVKKGDNVYIRYSAGGSLNAFRFYYAQGSESEAQ